MNVISATRLLSGQPPDKLSFHSNRYCCLVYEDAPVSTNVIKVTAIHSEGRPLIFSNINTHLLIFLYSICMCVFAWGHVGFIMH